MRNRIAGFLLLLALASAAPAQLLNREFPLAAPRIGPAPGDRSGLTISRSRDQHLAAWVDQRDGSQFAWAARLTLDGELRDPLGMPLGPGSMHWSHVEIATDGTDFLVAWNGGDTVDGLVKTARVTADGRVIALRDLGIKSESITALAWIGDGYALFFTELLNRPARAISVVILDREGRVRATPRQVQQAADYVPAIEAATGTGGAAVLLAWTAQSDPALRVRLLDVAGLRAGTIPTEPAPAPVKTLTSPPVVTGLATDGSGYLLTTRTGGTFTRFRAHRLDASGAPAGTVAEFDAEKLAPIHDGLQFFLEVRDKTGLTLRRLASDGSVAEQIRLDAPPKNVTAAVTVEHGRIVAVWAQPSTTGNPYELVYTAEVVTIGGPRRAFSAPRTLLSQGYSAIDGVDAVWRGDHYLAAWQERSNYARAMIGRFAANGVRLDGNGVILSSADKHATVPSIASDGRGAIAAWGEPGLAHVAVVDPYGRVSARYAFESEGLRPVVAWNGSQYAVLWTRRFNVGVFQSRSELHGIRLGSDGSVLDPSPRFAGHSTLVPVALAWTGRDYIAFSRSGTFGPFRIGAYLLGPELSDAGAILLADDSTGMPAIASSGEGVLITWTRNGKLRGFRFSQRSAPLHQLNGFEIGEGDLTLAARATSDGWEVLGRGDVWRLRRDGSVASHTPLFAFPSETATGHIVFGGPAPLLVYREPAAPVFGKLLVSATGGRRHAVRK